jgi:UDP-N-acetyl-D-mannosaminuronate dehydrogenase
MQGWGTAVVSVNNSVVDRLFNMIYENTKSGEKVALLGLSYKPGTYITEESPSLMLARKLTQACYAPCHSCESRNPYFHQGRSGFLLPQE